MSDRPGEARPAGATAVLAGAALRAGRVVRDVLIRIDARGRIASIEPRADRALPPGSLDLSARVVVPGTVNAHSHAFQVLLRGRCERFASFAQWVADGLYPLVQGLDVASVRAASRLAFAEMALNGVTTVGEFHYLHRGPGGADAGNDYAHAVLDAASEVGLRIVLLRAFYDVPGPAGRERFLEPPRVARQRIEELSSEIAGREEVSVAAAPHSLHGASREAFAQAKEWADGRGAVLHVHLAEQRDDVAFARERWGAPPLEALASMGVVDDRLAVVHGCWLEGGEIAQLAAAGASLVYNPGSNMALGDGVTDVEALVDAGVNVALGADGACANNQLDVFREMRLTEHLQRVTKHRMGVLTASRGAGVAWKMATRNGARALGLGPQDGTLEPGGVADLLALDPDDPSLQPLDLDAEDAGEILMAQLAFSAAPRGAVTDVLVGGRPIVRERRLALVSEREVAAAVRR